MPSLFHEFIQALGTEHSRLKQALQTTAVVLMLESGFQRNMICPENSKGRGRTRSSKTHTCLKMSVRDPRQQGRVGKARHSQEEV